MFRTRLPRAKDVPIITPSLQKTVGANGEFDVFSFIWSGVGPIAFAVPQIVFSNAQFPEARYLHRIRYSNYLQNAGAVIGRQAALISFPTGTTGFYDSLPVGAALGVGITQNYPMRLFHPANTSVGPVEVTYQKGEVYIPPVPLGCVMTYLVAVAAGEAVDNFLELSFYKP